MTDLPPPLDRTWAEQYVDAAFGQVGITSGDKYYSWLRENDLYVTRETARDVWREYRTSGEWLDTLQRYPETATIPRGWYGSTRSEYVDRYGYKFTVNYTDAITGQEMTTPYFLPSDRAMSKEEIEAFITARIEGGTGDVKGAVTSAAFTSMWHRAGAGW